MVRHLFAAESLRSPIYWRKRRQVRSHYPELRLLAVMSVEFALLSVTLSRIFWLPAFQRLWKQLQTDLVATLSSGWMDR